MKLPLGLVSVVVLVGCGPSPRSSRGGDDDGADAYQCVPSPEQCDDMVDNDCDGLTDCNDPDCSGIGTCPVCGMVQHPLSQPLALPDGDGAGPPYTSKLHFDGFGATQRFTDPSNIISVCVTIEHSWIRDLQIELHSPPPLGGGSPKILTLSKQLGNQCPTSPANAVCEVYLGRANDSDNAENPIPGVGAEYCWKPAATKPPMLQYANMGMPMLKYNNVAELPPGDYKAIDPWSVLNDAPLNGDWEISVQDRWSSDNGFIFKWSIAFDPSLVVDCSGPVIQ